MTTMVAVDAVAAVQDVGTNMMGIRSRSLYQVLHDVVEEHDFTVFGQAELSGALSNDFIQHITRTVPHDIFNNTVHSTETMEQLQKRLSFLAKYLTDKFFSRGKMPFTMVRICELCYNPFKYYKIHELPKFVRALEKCCLVETCWQTGHVISGNGGECTVTDEDISLTLIPWISKDAFEGLKSFVKEIDGIMSSNMEYEDDSDEDMDIEEDIDESLRRELGNDVIIEEFYDENNAEDSMGHENDDDDDDDDDYTGTSSEDEDDEEENEVDDDMQIPKSTFKRKPTELDDFDYITNKRPHDTTTPEKRQKENVNVYCSPDTTEDVLNSKEKQVEDEENLISPSTPEFTNSTDTSTNDNYKVNGMINEFNKSSPLNNKNRK